MHCGSTVSKLIKRVLPFVGIALLAWYVSGYHYQLVCIRGTSMEPTYSSGAIRVMDKHSKVYAQGDVVVFHSENIEGAVVKRVVGCPGDRVLIKEGQVFVNGRSLTAYPSIAYAGIAAEELILTEGQYFVMGDNFEHSIDSRHEMVGIVEQVRILGKIIN